MDQRIAQFRVGVMVLATLCITVILVLLFGQMPSLMNKSYPVVIHCLNAPGVTADTPILKSGIPIGRVSNVAFAKEGGVLITAAINSDVPLHRNETPRIAGGLLGDSSVQFVAFQDPRLARQRVQPGERIEGRVGGDVSQVIGSLEDDMQQLTESVSRASDDVSLLARKLTALLENNDQQLNRIVDKTELTLDALRAAGESANDIFGDPEARAGLRQSMADMPELFEDTRAAVNSMNNAFDNMNNTMSLADRNLRNLEGFTRPLGERGDEIFERIDRGAGRLDQLLEELTVFSAALNSREGSLGRLIDDRELYDNLNDAAVNIRDLTRNLQPVARDFRVFSDKVARHPEVLGVRGAISPSSGIK